MRGKIRVLVVGLLALAALEFGLLGASATGLVGGSTHELPPIPQRGIVNVSPTPVPTDTPEGGSADPNSIELFQPVPREIACDGSEESLVRVFVRDSFGNAVRVGTIVTFRALNSYLPMSVPTGPDGASASIRLYATYSGPNIFVTVGALEAAFWIRCKPKSDCPVSPPRERAIEAKVFRAGEAIRKTPL